MEGTRPISPLREELREKVADHRRRGAGIDLDCGQQANQACDVAGDSDYARGRTIGGPKLVPLRERLVRERQQLAERLSMIQGALCELDANPDFEKHEHTRMMLRAAGVHFD